MAITNLSGTDLISAGPTTINANFAQCVIGAASLTTAGAVPVVSAANTVTQDAANFFWNTSTHCLGIGTNAPAYAIDVATVGNQVRVKPTSGNAAFTAEGFGGKAWQVVSDTTGKFSIYNATDALTAIEIGTTGRIKFSTNNTTGSGSAALATNCPAVTPTAPYTWITVTTSDGSTGYIPVWK